MLAEALLASERRRDELKAELELLRGSHETVASLPPLAWIGERIAVLQDVLERRTELSGSAPARPAGQDSPRTSCATTASPLRDVAARHDPELVSRENFAAAGRQEERFRAGCPSRRWSVRGVPVATRIAVPIFDRVHSEARRLQLLIATIGVPSESKRPRRGDALIKLGAGRRWSRQVSIRARGRNGRPASPLEGRGPDSSAPSISRIPQSGNPDVSRGRKDYCSPLIDIMVPASIIDPMTR